MSPGSGPVSTTDPGLEFERRDDAPPWETFEKLAHENRFKILEALWESDTRPLSFATLHGRVDIRDSSRFNYHLARLTGTFIDKTDRGYDLTPQAEFVLSVFCRSAPKSRTCSR